jgi:hypothetical protein
LGECEGLTQFLELYNQPVVRERLSWEVAQKRRERKRRGGSGWACRRDYKERK